MNSRGGRRGVLVVDGAPWVGVAWWIWAWPQLKNGLRFELAP